MMSHKIHRIIGIHGKHYLVGIITNKVKVMSKNVMVLAKNSIVWL